MVGGRRAAGGSALQRRAVSGSAACLMQCRPPGRLGAGCAGFAAKSRLPWTHLNTRQLRMHASSGSAVHERMSQPVARQISRTHAPEGPAGGSGNGGGRVCMGRWGLREGEGVCRGPGTRVRSRRTGALHAGDGQPCKQAGHPPTMKPAASRVILSMAPLRRHTPRGRSSQGGRCMVSACMHAFEWRRLPPSSPLSPPVPPARTLWASAAPAPRPAPRLRCPAPSGGGLQGRRRVVGAGGGGAWGRAWIKHTAALQPGTQARIQSLLGQQTSRHAQSAAAMPLTAGLDPHERPAAGTGRAAAAAAAGAAAAAAQARGGQGRQQADLGQQLSAIKWIGHGRAALHVQAAAGGAAAAGVWAAAAAGDRRQQALVVRHAT